MPEWGLPNHNSKAQEAMMLLARIMVTLQMSKLISSSDEDTASQCLSILCALSMQN